MSPPLSLGKIPHATLQMLLSRLPKDRDVLIPPFVGSDAAGVKFSRKYYAVTTDPITFATEHIARYCVSVNINDIACMGARARFFTSTILLPKGTTEMALDQLWTELLCELNRYNIQAIAGHTEVTEAVNQPVLVGQMIGERVTRHFYNVRRIQAGDQLLLWRPIAIEGTSVLAVQRYDALARHILPEQLDTMKHLLDDPGVCILPGAEKLFPERGVVALHDPTEGGLASALHEMADASGCGLKINADAVPILSETQQLAKILKFDPLGLIASGCLLIACKKKRVEKVLNRLQGSVVSLIGEFTDDNDRIITTSRMKKSLPRFDQDEIIKAMQAKL
mgnify:CR=1 FL=1